jgi:L-ascorbate metabolism protein UlaG (beta-lactamase superfamily)
MAGVIGFAERARQLDHEHRKHQRSALPATLSMRFLRTALGRLARGTAPVEAASVAHPAAGTVSVTFVGHASVMITTPQSRILVDPLLETSLCGVRRAKAAGIADEDLDDVTLVLVTHAHRDHLSRKSLERLSGEAPVIVPPHCEALVRRVGLLTVEELSPGRSYTHADVEIIAVPVRHSGTRGLGDYTRRGACGYVIRTPLPAPGVTPVCVYVAGDTGYFSGFVEIGRRFHVDVALLPIAGYEPAGFREEHLSPLDAIYAFEDLAAHVLVPTSYGSFPFSYEPLDAPLAWLRELARTRGLLPTSAAPNGQGRRLCVLDHGETAHFRSHAAAAAISDQRP